MAYWNRLGATVTRVDDQNVAMKTAKVGSGNQPCWAPTDDYAVKYLSIQFPATPLLIVADHAGNSIPHWLGRLGVSESDTERHIGWDIGIAAVCIHSQRVRADFDPLRQSTTRLTQRNFDSAAPLSFINNGGNDGSRRTSLAARRSNPDHPSALALLALSQAA
jgi:hypothetical protein